MILKMKKICYLVHNYLQGLSTIKFIISITLLTYLILLPFAPLFYLYKKYIGAMGGTNAMSGTPISQIIIALILGPIVETAIFQRGVIEFLSSIKRLKEKSTIK